MNKIEQKVRDLELALNYVCYDASLIPKLSKVWDKLELLKEEVNKNCNAPEVSNSFTFEILIFRKAFPNEVFDADNFYDWASENATKAFKLSLEVARDIGY